MVMAYFIMHLACFQAVILCFSLTNGIQYVNVTTQVGEIEGFVDMVRIDSGMHSVVKFLGIPYAETTAGNNRFDKPIPKAPFKTKYSALSYPPSCYQILQDPTIQRQVLSEDCLYMNIYVPNEGQKAPLSVMIWIHGGAFQVGAASLYKAEALSVFGKVIIVTINYRLGIFGFLRSDNGVLEGNQGLWDQHLAIKWVHDNIASFGGNPNEVTIFGESAGSTSVLLQSLYPENSGLFKRVIAESGTALSYWAVTPPVGGTALKLTGCQDAIDPIFCLRLFSPLDLQNKTRMYQGQAVLYYPSVDGDFLTETPHDIIYGNNTISSRARSFFSSLDIITGVNNFDGALYLKDVWPGILNETFPNIHVTQDQFSNLIVPQSVRGVFKPNCKRVEDLLNSAIVFEYTDWQDPKNDTKVRGKLVDMSSDIAFFSPAIDTVKAHSMFRQGRTYFYLFGLDLDFSQHALPTPDFIKGKTGVTPL